MKEVNTGRTTVPPLKPATTLTDMDQDFLNPKNVDVIRIFTPSGVVIKKSISYYLSSLLILSSFIVFNFCGNNCLPVRFKLKILCTTKIVQKLNEVKSFRISSRIQKHNLKKDHPFTKQEICHTKDIIKINRDLVEAEPLKNSNNTMKVENSYAVIYILR